MLSQRLDQLKVATAAAIVPQLLGTVGCRRVIGVLVLRDPDDSDLHQPSS
jgi:hypothetical protein